MTVSAIGGSPAIVATAALKVAPAAEALEGPETPGSNDHDGDDKIAPTTSPAASSSNAVQAALTTLKVGG